MPIYEFVCQNCGHEFEKILSFSAQTTPSCAVCQSTQVVRQMGRPAIHFKGSGWYINDSKTNKDSANGADSKPGEKTPPLAEATPATTSSDVKSDTKSESKSESKSDTKSESKSDTKENRPSTASAS